ncbi:DUF1906 domain-containing protein [Corynebacterium caspium]|uniref:DUF1906 domain-containing protein n=1 Tax=Corynebacterium caspium TaxID=234828 RepID=UPI000364D2ED|nr:DUF1906 domain-containing protein [Corynebacterium caspium]WKD58928.1 hypothetical protein CCASP_02605 [Corynebacterium caspium DSM 44850]
MSQFSPMSRRQALKAAAFAIATGSIVATAPATATAQGRILGKVIDYAAGVPSAQSIRNKGYIGAVRYVSQRRPGTENWMLGKPVTLNETRAFASHGLEVASVYQFGKAETADWKRGAAGAAAHAPQAIALHAAAGGPQNRPIYVAIDDNPTRAQYEHQIRPYLQAFKVALEASGYKLGIYGNYNTIDWAIKDGLGQYFWQHNWGSGGRIHPRVTLHQVSNEGDKIDGISVDINHVYAADWGQWKPGNAVNNFIPNIPGITNGTRPTIEGLPPELSQLSSNPQIMHLVQLALDALRAHFRVIGLSS